MTDKRFQWVYIGDGELEFNDYGVVRRFERYRLEEFLNELHEQIEELKEEKEYYRKYALHYLKEFPIYSDSFIESMRSIEGDEFAIKMLKDREQIINALKMEGLYDK